MTPERRQGIEFRISGRALTGLALVYGDTSPDFQECFEPGAFGGDVTAPIMNLQHDPELVILPAGGYALIDGPRDLRVRAELPESSAALKLVQRGALNSFSIEFQSRRERSEAGIRVIERAALSGLALVDHGAYPQSKAEVRRAEHRASLGRFRGRVPVNRQLDCQCAPGSCKSAYFKAGAFRQVPARERDILAVVGDYSGAIASRDRGGLRLRLDDDGSLDFNFDIPDSTRGRALMDSYEVTPIYGRPVLDVVMLDGVATYERAEVRALTIAPTDAGVGWTALELVTVDDDDPPAPQRAARRRTTWLP